MIATFHLPPASPTAFEMLNSLPSWMVWLRKLIERWSSKTTYQVSARGLKIAGTLYGRVVGRSVLQASAGRAVDLETEQGFKPVIRTNGIGLPGYGAGWFRLASGEKALAFITDKNRVVYIPTTAGYALFLSVNDPNAFLATLRSI